MLKTQNRSVAKGGKLRSKAKAVSSKKQAIKLTAEQQARLDAFNKMVTVWEQRWDSLSPKEQREEMRAHDRVMKSIKKYPLSLREYKPADGCE